MYNVIIISAPRSCALTISREPIGHRVGPTAARVGVRPRNTKPNRIILLLLLPTTITAADINDILWTLRLSLSLIHPMSLAHSISVSHTLSAASLAHCLFTPSLPAAIQDADRRERVRRAAITAESIGKHVIAAAAALECLAYNNMYTGRDTGDVRNACGQRVKR